MTDEKQSENKTADGLFKEGPRDETIGVDPMDFTAEDGSPVGFDEFLRSFDEPQAEFDGESDPGDEFGTLKESEIPIGRSGLQPPELDGGELGHDEIAFGIVEGELRAIVKALALLLKHRPAAHRRCRLTIKPGGVTWHANEGNGFIEYFTPGRPTNLRDTDFRIVIVALADLHASARAARDVATFRIRNDKIQFSAKRFFRPILTFPSRTFTAHTDALRMNVDVNVERSEVSAKILLDALTFLASIAPSDESHAGLNLIEIKDGTARATGLNMAGQVETSAFDGLNITFRPRFLRWVLPALKLRATFKVWHSGNFCLIGNDQLTLGFELVQEKLTSLPTITLADTLLVPSGSLRTFVARAFRMFGLGARLTFQSDERGVGTQFSASADDNGQSPGRLTTPLTANREGPHIGPLRITVGAVAMLQALRMSEGTANTEIFVTTKQAIYIDNPLDDAKYSVILKAQVEKL